MRESQSSSHGERTVSPLTASRDGVLPFSLTDTGAAERALVGEVIDSGSLVAGRFTRQFEEEFAGTVGAKYAVAVSSYTAAMHLAMEAIGLRKGDEVVTTPYAFASTAAAIHYFSAKPVFVDIESLTFNIDTRLIQRRMTDRTKAIVPVHVGGLPADLDVVRDLARQHECAVIENAAGAFPAKYCGTMLGGISDLTCFSFGPTNPLTTGEGGMVCTNDARYAEHCRTMAQHGIVRDAWKRYTAEGSWHYEITAPGFNYAMTDLAGAMGLAQLRRSSAMLMRRTQIAKKYSEAFSPMHQLQVPWDNPAHQHAWYLYMLRLNLETLTIDRAQFFDELRRRKIEAAVHFIPLHLHPYYRDTYGLRPEQFPLATREYLREISLPIYSRMTDGDAQRVIDAVTDVVNQYKR